MRCEECPWFEYEEATDAGICIFNDWLWKHNADGNPPCVEEED